MDVCYYQIKLINQIINQISTPLFTIIRTFFLGIHLDCGRTQAEFSLTVSSY